MLRVLTEEELDQIRKRDQARTPGEWMWDSYSGIMVRVPKDHFLNYSFPDEPPIGYIAWIDGGQGQQGDELQNPEAKANADFIASNSLDVPNLLTTVEALQKQLEQLKGMSKKINQTKSYMKSPEEIKQISKREALKWLDGGDDDD